MAVEGAPIHDDSIGDESQGVENTLKHDQDPYHESILELGEIPTHLDTVDRSGRKDGTSSQAGLEALARDNPNIRGTARLSTGGHEMSHRNTQAGNLAKMRRSRDFEIQKARDVVVDEARRSGRTLNDIRAQKRAEDDRTIHNKYLEDIRGLDASGEQISQEIDVERSILHMESELRSLEKQAEASEKGVNGMVNRLSKLIFGKSEDEQEIERHMMNLRNRIRKSRDVLKSIKGKASASAGPAGEVLDRKAGI